MDYWALGHVHSRRVLSEKPWVVYSGCVQGKDIHEPGKQGCFLVEHNGFGELSMTFHPTSVLDFEVVSLNISDIENLGSVMKLLQEKLISLKEHNDLIFRLKLTGITPLDVELRNWDQEELQRTVSSFLKENRNRPLIASFITCLFVIIAGTLIPVSLLNRKLKKMMLRAVFTKRLI